jgi:transketolase
MAHPLEDLAAQLRVDSIRATTAAGSGHPTSSLSAADLMAVLLARQFRYDWARPDYPNNDRLVFSKGHASPLLYAMFKAAGAITDDELMSLRKFGSRLEGHPTPRLPFVDVATGSLGQGIGAAVGMALEGKYLSKLPFRVWTLLGDSECAEGSVWEAFDKAWYYKLDRLVAIIDVNRLGQRGETELGWHTSAYAARVRAFGWHAIELDGHDLGAIERAYEEALATMGRPTCLIAKTEKGHGVRAVANKNGWHGKAFPADLAKTAIEGLGGVRQRIYDVRKPEPAKPAIAPSSQPLVLPTYAKGGKEATRKAYGDALVALGANRSDVVVLDGEVSNSTHADEFHGAYPDRFFEMFIAEQTMVSAATGLAVLGRCVFASTFAAFMTRAHDQIRMASISEASLRLCGSHAGVSIGEDGPSQMALDDLAMMRSVPGAAVLYPCDANQTAHLVARMAEREGISYLRTTREKTPVVYDANESFEIGGSKELRRSDNDRVAVIAAGITVREALEAHARLERDGVHIRVIDLYSVKPVDRVTLRRAAEQTGGKLVVVEDHWVEGGLGDAVLEAFSDPGVMHPSIVRLAVREIPGSGKPEELLRQAGIDAEHIVAAVRSLL